MGRVVVTSIFLVDISSSPGQVEKKTLEVKCTSSDGSFFSVCSCSKKRPGAEMMSALICEKKPVGMFGYSYAALLGRHLPIRRKRC